jgi:hypothetical protein
MTIFKVGQIFPDQNPVPGEEYAVSELNKEFFDIRAYFKYVIPVEVEMWQRAGIKYGVHVISNIPFLLVCFEYTGWRLDVTLNILKVQNATQINDWLNNKNTVINLFLLDTLTNILLAIRTISIHKEIAELVRNVLEMQTKTYSTLEEVDLRIAGILHALSIQDMIDRTEMLVLKSQ